MNRRSDNTFGGARPLQFDRTIRDSVGQRDRIDIYKFTASSAGNFSMRLTGLRGNANVRLLNDRAGTIAASNQPRNRPEQIRANLETGTYYLQVQYVDRRGATPYRLQSTLTPNSPVPPPPPPPPVGDNSIATAFNLGTITTTTVKEESLGSEDPVDFFKFTLSDITNLRIGVEQFSGAGTYELIRDDNNNGLVDDEVYSSSFLFGTLPPIDMPPGTYFLRASSNSATRYRLTFVPTLFGGNVSPDPGSTLASAFDLGVSSGTRSIKEYIGTFDGTDLYKFTLNDLSTLQITRSSSSGNANLDPQVQLIRDSNNNGLIDNNEIFANDNNFGVLSDSATIDVPVGTYFMRVQPRSGGTAYELNLVGTPFGGNGLPDPGNTLSAARDLGVLSGTSSLKEYVGLLDSNDFYRFTLSNTTNLQARLTASNSLSIFPLSLIQDTNNNGLIDSNETITSGDFNRNLGAGTYFIRVSAFGSASTNYELVLVTP